jgi:hypothetical protein
MHTIMMMIIAINFYHNNRNIRDKLPDKANFVLIVMPILFISRIKVLIGTISIIIPIYLLIYKYNTKIYYNNYIISMQLYPANKVIHDCPATNQVC